MTRRPPSTGNRSPSARSVVMGSRLRRRASEPALRRHERRRSAGCNRISAPNAPPMWSGCACVTTKRRISRGDRPRDAIAACSRGSEPRRPASMTVMSSSRIAKAVAPISGTAKILSATSVRDERDNVEARELLTAFESGELDEERDRDDLALELLHELDRPRDSAAGGEQIIDDQDFRARFDRVLVHLERRRTVLEVVFDADHVGWELPKLAHRHEPDAEVVGDGGAEDEAPRLHADDDVDVARADALHEPVDSGLERIAVLEERRDVLEEDPRLGEV